MGDSQSWDDAVRGVYGTQGILYFAVCCTQCMLHSVYAALGVGRNRCMLYSVLTVAPGME